MQQRSTAHKIPQDVEARRKEMLRLWKHKAYGRRMRQAKKRRVERKKEFQKAIRENLTKEKPWKTWRCRKRKATGKATR